jgi:2-phospho-L-lactate guanylyltransferase
VRALLVPVKAFGAAKLRLASVLSDSERAELARRLATTVLAAGGDLRTNVVCEDDEVAAWAETHGARVIWTPNLGLSGAVAAGVNVLAGEGATLVVVAHADLPFAAGLDVLGRDGVVTLVPDTRNDGTNVAVVPASAGFAFGYGPGSFKRHQLEASRLGLECEIVRDSRLAADIDIPDDLGHLPAAELLAIRAAAARSGAAVADLAET